MPKTEVYSWRLSAEKKESLELAARRKQCSVSQLLDEIVEHWLVDSANLSDDNEIEKQKRLHYAAAEAIGTISGKNPDRSQHRREYIRKRLAKKHGG